MWVLNGNGIFNDFLKKLVMMIFEVFGDGRK
jgi:hypothetical protein